MSIISRIVKLSAKTAPPFTKTRNHFKVEIPDGMVYDFAKSYIVLNTDLETSGDAGVHKVFLGTDTYNYPADCLLKNVSLRSAKQGNLEDVHQVNILNHNLDLVKRGYARNFNNMTDFGVGLENDLEYTGITRTAFRTLGLTESKNRAVDLRVGFKRLFGIGWADTFNMAKTGKMTIDFELENVIPVISENINYDVGATLACDAVVAGGDPVLKILSTATTFDVDAKLTLWADCYVKVAYTPTGGAPTEKLTTIKAVVKTAGNKMEIELNDNLGSVDISGVSLVQVKAPTVDYKINDVSFVLYQKGGKIADEDVSFNTWKVEMVNKQATTTFDRNFDIQGGCSTVIGMCPLVNELTSQADSCNFYRFSLDGKDTTDQSIKPHDMLYNDRVMMTFENAGIPANSMLNTNTLFCNPIPLVDKQQVLHLNMTHSVASASPVTYLYKLIEQDL
mgnify:CR=1 FL=1